ncbi:GCN5-related N-acetyltransferase [Serratia plymuthica 4Rx13]|uniref:N-acetyltransferase n=1 Tax=Serratia plymuthica TaxID=82996 RepID=A0A318P2C0_SERPL|nr:GNAT family N-acetyltransferase [Serratia plymuthica]AGO53471.1 GCN5-related N-acetyltransferase [Serratia plymuthica 4Rx13]PYD38632.1 N-acetyltransferase [Serratia plymuthica]
MKHQPRSVIADNNNQPNAVNDGPLFTWHKGALTISTDRRLLDIDFIHHFLRHSHWAQGIGRATLEHAIRHSLCFGLYRKKRQIGFARVVTDHATFAWLSDVFITAEYRGNGLGQWLMHSCLEHPLMSGLHRIMLYASQAPWLYAKVGYEPINQPDRVWTITQPAIDQPCGALNIPLSVH